MTAHILVVEDDLDLREALTDTLELAGYQISEADCGEKALDVLALKTFDLVVSDVNMPGIDGHELLARINSLYPFIPVILATAYGNVERAVDAMRVGAVDYLIKPFKPEVLVETVGKYLSGPILTNADSGPVAEETSSKQLLGMAQRVALSDSTVLISGESGTGKEVLARYIHQHSDRSEKPFVAINCAAIPESMLESMLFGHEKGAFTGAYNSSPGKFEQADGGTILLDEISEMDISLQAKLLRVLQEREVERVGGRKTISLNVRVLATTNRDLLGEVGAGRFREDLYYRLSVFPLQWLPLRQRPADILPLAERLVKSHARKMNKPVITLDSSAKQTLVQHRWPGNVRELDNAVQRALILQQGNTISAQDFFMQPMAMPDPAPITSAPLSVVQPVTSRPTYTETVGGEAVVGETEVEDIDETAAVLGDGVKQHEFQLIIDALKNEKGKKKQAAERLGISPRTLRYKLAKMRDSGIDLNAAMAG